MIVKLTKRSLDALPPGTDSYFAWDSELKGFGVRVMRTGRKTFITRFREGGRQRSVKVGVYGVLTCEEARTVARQILGEVAKGTHLAENIRTYRRSPDVASLCERYFEEHVRQRCKPSTQAEYRRSIDLFIKPAFGTWKIRDVTRTDVADLHHRMRNIPYQANRTLGVLSKMFNLAELWGLRPDGSNPCRHVAKYKERKRERFLSPAEIKRLGEVLDEVEASGAESRSAVAAFRLLLLTGCRLGEIQTLQWEYLSSRYIILPDSKTGPRRIPITPAVQEVLDGVERLAENPHVIWGKVPGQYLTDLQHPWRRIRALAGLDEVRIHDLRHTYASNAIAAGQSIVMVGKLLGHTQVQTTARYAHLADDHVREAAHTVASDLEAMLLRGDPYRPGPGAPGGMVVGFPRGVRSA